ncbi:MAG: hypothetical protein OEU53_03535 [Gammaproteobacteria bacterium]|nr:hypothetical protein [Gammaproteobacteria bacterium]
MKILRLSICWLAFCTLQVQARPVEAAAEEPEAEATREQAIAKDIDGSLDDASNSIDVDTAVDRLGLSADLRLAYTGTDIDSGPELDFVENVLRARWRLRTEFGVTPHLRAVGRVAGLCSNEECSPNVTIEDSIPARSGMQDGDITVDEAYLHWFRPKRFDLALGRLQTKFVARGGVFAKSLDRNDSNNTNVNWTDGLHATFRGWGGWKPHLVLQHNSSDGPTNVRRGPLDFSDPGARVSYFLAFESLERTPYFLQRGLDITYMPKSLLADGALSARREDYYAFVVRTAGRWPERDEGIRLRTSAEIGYAPVTPTKAAEGLNGEGDVDGLAWNITISVMDFMPNHSIGINYGRAGAGWLISPQFRRNEELAEIRYQWRRSNGLALDFRIRAREELESSAPGRGGFRDVDFLLRFTRGWTLR